MNTRWSNIEVLKYGQWSAVIYLLLFQSWKAFVDYPAGILQETYKPVGIFHILPGPLNESLLDTIFYVWPLFLVLSLFTKFRILGLWGSFILGCYVLGYSYNYGRIFHGTSLILQIIFLLALSFTLAKNKMDNNRAALTLWVAQFLIGFSYFSSGVSKILKSGFEWALSENLAVILHTQALTTQLQNILLSFPSWVLQLLALFILCIELTSLLPVFFPRLRLFYALCWTLFHIGVSFSLGGHITFFSHLFLFIFFFNSSKPLQTHGRQ